MVFLFLKFNLKKMFLVMVMVIRIFDMINLMYCIVGGWLFVVIVVFVMIFGGLFVFKVLFVDVFFDVIFLFV